MAHSYITGDEHPRLLSDLRSVRLFDGIKPLDAPHLATAATARVDLFVTHDMKLLSHIVPGIDAVLDTKDQLPTQVHLPQGKSQILRP